MYHIVPQCPGPVSYSTRPLPIGDCGFLWASTKETPGAACQCKTFWPSPANPLTCACGHHACYHSEKPSQSNHHHVPPSAPSDVITRSLEAKLQELRETVAILEAGLVDRDERLKGVETLSAELNSEVDDLRDRGDMLEDTFEAIKTNLPLARPMTPISAPDTQGEQEFPAAPPSPAISDSNSPSSSSLRMKRRIEDVKAEEEDMREQGKPREILTTPTPTTTATRSSGRTTKKAKR